MNKKSILDVYDEKQRDKDIELERHYIDFQKWCAVKDRVNELKGKIDQALIEGDREVFSQCSEELMGAEEERVRFEEMQTEINVESADKWRDLATKCALVYEKSLILEEIDESLEERNRADFINLCGQLEILEKELKFFE